jgi:hypothetical protein
LILSKAIAEYSTEDVIDWLVYYNAEFLRINGDDLFEKEISISNQTNLIIK